MATSKDVFAYIEKLGMPIPEPGVPNGLYDMVTIYNDIAYTSGQLSRLDNTGGLITGPIGGDDPITEAALAAKACLVRGLCALDQKLGDLERINKFIFIRGFINAQPDFTQHSRVLNEVSQIVVDTFGKEIGTHSRSALGAGSLPSLGLVEIEFVVGIDS